MSDPFDDLRSSIARARRAGDRAVEFEHGAALARLLLRARQPDEAVFTAERLARLAAEIACPAQRRNSLIELGAFWAAAGEHRRALDTFGAAVELAGPNGEDDAPDEVIRALAGMGRARLALGEAAAAAAHYERALALARRHALIACEAEVLGGLGRACMAEGRPAWAAGCFREAALLARAMLDAGGTLQYLDGLAAALLALGDGAGAARALEDALALARVRLEHTREAELLVHLGRAHCLAGRAPLACVAYEEAAALACDLCHPELERRARTAAATCRCGAGMGIGDW